MTSTSRSAWWCGLLAVATAAACGGGDPEPGIDASFDGGTTDAGADAGGMCTEFTPEYCPREYPMTPIAINTICEVFADMFCRANGNCCERPDEVYPTFAACISDQVARCMHPVSGYEHSAALAGGTLDYNSAAMGEQRAMLGRMSDVCTPVRFGDAILTSMQGRVASGGACAVSPECVSGHECRGSVCSSEPSIGSTCAGHDECAAGGLRCDGATCAARLEDLAGCTDDDECESRLCVEGRCEPWRAGLAYCVRAGDAGRAFEH